MEKICIFCPLKDVLFKLNDNDHLINKNGPF